MQAAKTIKYSSVRIYSYRRKKDPEVLAQNTEGIFTCSSSTTMSVVVDKGYLFGHEDTVSSM